MKLRRLPEDFQVEELTSLRPDRGPYALYRLTKTSIGTPEAIAAISRQWKVARRRISYGGLKDRHAVTVQYLTIHQGPQRGMQQKSFALNHVGQTNAPYTSAEIQANRFALTLRDMAAADVERAIAAIGDLRVTGLPNYFDDQRFGSLGQSQEWIGRAWCLGDYERALWLALADPHLGDSADEKRQKQILRDHWGQWSACKPALDRSHRRSIVTYLSDKIQAGKSADPRGAFARISVDLRGLYLSAYQSALWNRLLTRFQEFSFPEKSLIPFDLTSGRCLFTTAQAMAAQTEGAGRNDSDSVFETFRNAELPLPSARIDRPEGLIGDLLDQVLQEEETELRQLRVKYPRDSFFSKGIRRAFVTPAHLTATAADDELYARRKKLLLSFELPRGSYATILVKRVTEC